MDNPNMQAMRYLNYAANDVRRGVDSVFEGTGMSDLQWVILRHVHGTGTTVAQVAQRIGHDPEVVGREVFKLERSGLIRVQHENKQASNVVTLTHKAEEQLPALSVAAEAVADRATSGLTNDELASLTLMLKRIMENLD